MRTSSFGRNTRTRKKQFLKLGRRFRDTARIRLRDLRRWKDYLLRCILFIRSERYLPLQRFGPYMGRYLYMPFPRFSVRFTTQSYAESTFLVIRKPKSKKPIGYKVVYSQENRDKAIVLHFYYCKGLP